jgi:hypothetical protein
MFLQMGLGGGRIFVRFLAHTLNLSSPAKAKARPEADNKKKCKTSINEIARQMGSIDPMESAGVSFRPLRVQWTEIKRRRC